MDLLTKDGHPGLPSSMIDLRKDIHDGEGASRNTVDLVDEVHDRYGEIVGSATSNLLLEGDLDIVPHSDLEFESHEAAYKFYQEYAKSVGFITSIKNSRRSKKSKDFIDAKFACSRYGLSPESDTCSSRRPNVKKTDCKASMHVKRNKSGKWIVHEFIKEHNHELLPALAYHFRIHRDVKLVEKNNVDILHAVSERTKKMYVEMSRQYACFLNLGSLRDDPGCQYDKGSCLALDEGDAQILLDYFMRVRKENPKFFYAIEFNEEQQLRNLVWVDAKSRSDYISFGDVVSLDTSYIRTNDKVPVVLLIGVNHHFQPMLLGCALVADDLTSTFVWLMKTWLRAMGGKAPHVIITNQHPSIKATIQEVFPNTRHCFHLWNVVEKVQENLAHVIKRHENFAGKFNKCIFKSWTEEQFELKWWKMIGRFDLHDDEWVRSLFEDRKKWVPLYMGDTFLAGMSPVHRGESVSSFFDRYFIRKLTLREFVKQYGVILQNRYEEEAIADFDTWHKQPALKSPSPWEKQMSTIYTHAIFKKFQVEVLGVVGCHPKKEDGDGDGTSVTYFVEDCEKNEAFSVTWDETKSHVSCLCRSFEYRGFLCRHAMIVLQICGVSSIPSQYILRRWTKDAKSRQIRVEGTERVQTRAQHYVALSKQAIELSEEGSLTHESYNIALRALADTLKNCINVNNANKGAVEVGNDTYGTLDVEGGRPGNILTRTGKKKNTVKRRKVPSEADTMMNDEDNIHQMENIRSGGISLNGYYGSQQNVQGLLNLMEPPHENYYVDQESMQGLGQLNSLGPSHEGFFGAQHSVHGLGHLDYRPSTSFSYSLQDEHSLRSIQLHGDASRHT